MRQQVITNLMGATSSGNAPSAAFGGIIGQFVSWRALFLLYGLGALLIAAMLFRVSVDQGESAGPAPTARADRRYGEVLHLRQARLLFLFVGLEGVFSYGGFTYLGAYLNARFGIDYLTIGIILASYGTGTVLTSRFASRALKRLGEANLILVGGLLLSISYPALLPLPWWFGDLASLLGLGAGFALFHSNLRIRDTELVPGFRGTSVARFAFFLCLGGAVGSAVLGEVINVAGYVPMILISGVGLLRVTAVARRSW